MIDFKLYDKTSVRILIISIYVFDFISFFIT